MHAHVDFRISMCSSHGSGAPCGGASGGRSDSADADRDLEEGRSHAPGVLRAAGRSDLEEGRESYGLATDPWLLIDSLVLREILLNLTQNAVRFTSAGSVVLSVDLSHSTSAIPGMCERGRLPTHRRRCARARHSMTRTHMCTAGALCARFDVRDTGCGISPKTMETVFQRYASVGGIGIGCMLAHRQVAMMGGTLTATSPWAEDGSSGTSMSFIVELLPAHGLRASALDDSTPAVTMQLPAADQSRAAAAPKLPEMLRVLIADDQKMNNLLMSRVLKQHVCASWTLTVEEVSEAALETFKAAMAAGSPFDLVIIDENFDARSSMTGTDVIHQMRRAEQTRGGGAAVMVSCSGGAAIEQDATAERAQAGVLDAVWGKPIPSWSDGTMQRMLAALLAARRNGQCG